MTHILDTDVVINHLRGAFNLFQRSSDSSLLCCISAITVHELRFGAAKSKRQDAHLSVDLVLANLPVIPLDVMIAEISAQIRLDLERRGEMIGVMDILIAATALSQNLILVTGNTREFSRVHNLHLEDWR